LTWTGPSSKPKVVAHFQRTQKTGNGSMKQRCPRNLKN
jgi:hypothetical protein